MLNRLPMSLSVPTTANCFKVSKTASLRAGGTPLAPPLLWNRLQISYSTRLLQTMTQRFQLFLLVMEGKKYLCHRYLATCLPKPHPRQPAQVLPPSPRLLQSGLTMARWVLLPRSQPRQPPPRLLQSGLTMV